MISPPFPIPTCAASRCALRGVLVAAVLSLTPGVVVGEFDLQFTIDDDFTPEHRQILIDALTDNKNRAVSEIKHALGKFGGSLGGPGSVQWQFSRLGVARLAANQKSKIKNLKSKVLFPQQMDVPYMHVAYALPLGNAFAVQGMCSRCGGQVLEIEVWIKGEQAVWDIWVQVCNVAG